MRLRDIRVPYVLLLIAPAILWFFGYACNAIEITSNGGFMPVQGFTECIGHASADRDDHIHVCMDKTSRLKILGDWVYTPAGTASLGDALEYAGEYTMYPCLFIWFGFVIRDYSEDDEDWY